MPYLLLLGAIVVEVIATSLLKSTEGFTRLWPTVAVLTAYAAAFALLSQAVSRGMEVGVGYALWSALGTTAIVVIGVLFLDEPITALKVTGVALVVAGVTALNLGGAH
ncbi:MAG TPA: multidrug efflux SMR transporter [Thermomonospora sp.]|nr:multidrug efflux SMR transporter [Thermomonospora sp.]